MVFIGLSWLRYAHLNFLKLINLLKCDTVQSLRYASSFEETFSLHLQGSRFFYQWGGTFGTAATTGLLYKPQVMVMVIVEKLVE
jgi:hypothetical protein